MGVGAPPGALAYERHLVLRLEGHLLVERPADSDDPARQQAAQGQPDVAHHGRITVVIDAHGAGGREGL